MPANIETTTALYAKDFDIHKLCNLFGRHQSVALNEKRLPGFLKKYLAIATKITDAQPGALITAWLPVVACNIGNRVFIANNSGRIYCNIWAAIIGPSSISRKTTAIKLATKTIYEHEKTLADADVKEYNKKTLKLSDVTMAKMMSLLSINPVRLFCQNELSAWLALMNKQYNSGMKQAVTDLYDGVDKTISNMERTERIVKPAFSVVAASTEGWLYSSLKDTAEQGSGFLQRFLFYVVRNVNIDNIDLSYREGAEESKELQGYDGIFSIFRSIPGHYRLGLSQAAIDYRTEAFQKFFKQTFAMKNDALMSYFTRIFDGYWFKFCIMFTLFEHISELKDAIANTQCRNFFESIKVSEETAIQAFELCEFYFQNTIPFMNILEEADKLSGERKIVEALCNEFKGKATHSQLMNRVRMGKREFNDNIQTLMERGGLTVDIDTASRKPAKSYRLAQDILDSWEVT
jgi:hypothetical protein